MAELTVKGSGLRYLYGKNPHERRIAATGAVMKGAGYARPLMAMALGRETSAAEEWDVERTKYLEGVYTQGQNQAAAMKALELAIDLSEKDPVAATQVLQAEIARNPAMQAYKGIKFAGATTRETLTLQIDNPDLAPEGEGTYQVDKRFFGEWGQLSDADKQNPEMVLPLAKKYMVKLRGKEEKAPTTRTVQRDGERITEEFKEGTWGEVGRGPAWKPDKAEGETPSDIRKEKGTIRREMLSHKKAIIDAISDKSLVELILGATQDDKNKIAKAFAEKGEVLDAHIKDIINLYLDAKADYEAVAGTVKPPPKAEPPPKTEPPPKGESIIDLLKKRKKEL